MQRVSYFDVETSPASPEVLAKLKPEFTAPSNYKDKDKIAANIAEQEQNWLDRAALSAETGKVLVIGVLDGDRCEYFEGAEDVILTRFWPWLDMSLGRGDRVVGFCIFNFDLPFLVRRSYINGVRVNLDRFRSRYWNAGMVDIAEQWQLGNREQRISLDMLGKVLGVGSKNGSGADFAALYATDRVKALQYLENDLRLSKACYERMNPI